LMRGLGAAIDQQFARWSLTPAEAEVALLMLKGLSHTEISRIRGVSAATTCQQARATDKKAGLVGRHELIAFFLEDLMLPPEASG
jgi:DNA-binding CsgD family transcriptional regulator